ncbi:acyltransferase family protein [Cellulosimicrobium marinum]|uniref:acyltransferase family protein n=1 Tax=Cellulosimicrobium marinum TaxID=1638992 RepID=UPI001E5794CF|nr:acyltransferase [Cellulosimicrobium marinum]MCB7137037.1 acyltransferase [Cellulosimicrobium marinum]
MTSTRPATVVPGTVPLTGQGRARWMDVLRGSAILLVVLSHATAVVGSVVGAPRWMDTVDVFFAPYRMPALMVLSGMLLPRAFGKPLPAYYLGKARTLLWPYVVWVVVLAAVGGAPGPLLEPRTWYATSYLWFVFYLLVYFSVAPVLRRAPRWLLVVVAVALVVVSTPMDAAADGRTKALLYLGAFFVAGYALARSPGVVAAVTAGRGRWVAIGLAPLPGVLAVSTGTFTHEGLFALASAVGVLGAVALTTAVVGPRTHGVETLGRHSVVTYVTHYPLFVVVAAALGAAGVGVLPAGAAVLTVLGAFALAVAVGYALVRLRRYAVVGWLFEWPARAVPRRWAPAPSPSPEPGDVRPGESVR